METNEDRRSRQRRFTDRRFADRQDKTKTNSMPLSDLNAHLLRPRINALLAQAIQKPLTIVCAGMGYGKTRAVYDFVQECAFPVMWLSFADAENLVSYFWGMCVRAVAQTNAPYAKELKKLGLPDTADKLSMYFTLQKRAQPNKRRLFVVDDFHLAKDAAVLNFLEQTIIMMQKDFSLTSTLLISREMPAINISSLMVRNMVCIINESELNFTESELRQFLLQQNLHSETNSLSKIHTDTRGWAFIIDFVARILKKTPGYMGYARSAIRQDITLLIEAEAWNKLSEPLKRFFLRLSLTDHRPMELVNILAGGDEKLLADLQQQNAFVYYDRYMDSYRIHRLFLDFLHTKQGMLADDERRNAHKAIADWCAQNDFIIDALYTYEKIGDYESIVSILFASSLELFQNIASHTATIFHRAPEEIFDRVEFSAAVHIHSVMCTGDFQKTLDLMRHYEAKYLRLPEDNAFKNQMLGCIYYLFGVLRMVLYTVDDCCDFDIYFAKQYECLKNFPVNPKCWYQHPGALWTGLAGSARAGAPQEYLDTLTRGMQYTQSCVKGLAMGIEDLCHGELLFYQGDTHEAEIYATKAMERAQEYLQCEIIFRALLIIMRIAVFQGDYAKLGLALKDAERQLTDHECSIRFSTYDIVLGWYHYILGQQQKMPGWLKEKFTYRPYATTLENLGNYIKTKYAYQARNYIDLMEYLERKTQKGTILYERVESLVMKACVHVNMNDEKAALNVLQEAYETALPNGLVTPFIELGKDMRTLIDLAEGCQECTIPSPWLKNIQQRASAYFRNQTRIISIYNKVHGIDNKTLLSPRETVILHDLSDRLSRSEIAAKHALSINTVKQHINNIYNKLGACNRADMLRIAAEYKLV